MPIDIKHLNGMFLVVLGTAPLNKRLACREIRWCIGVIAHRVVVNLGTFDEPFLPKGWGAPIALHRIQGSSVENARWKPVEAEEGPVVVLIGILLSRAVAKRLQKRGFEIDTDLLGEERHA